MGIGCSNKMIVDKNDLINRFINPYNNDMFSKLKGGELLDLLYYINNYDLSFRKNLGLDKGDTFGTELEFKINNMNDLNRIKNYVKKEYGDNEWGNVVADDCLRKIYEISSPVLRDSSIHWDDLINVCSILNKNSIINNNCGGHIHVGSQLLGNNVKVWLNFILLWSVYENIIFRFGFGNYLTSRSAILEFAKPVSDFFLEDYSNFSESNDYDLSFLMLSLSYSVNMAVNFHKVISGEEALDNTIEIRCFNAPKDMDPVIWQNNINFLLKFMKMCRKMDIDIDLVRKRRKINSSIYGSLEYYNEIYLEQVLEFVDLIFDNNMDKVYFIRQYLKSYEIGKYNLEPAKVFTKKLKV